MFKPGCLKFQMAAKAKKRCFTFIFYLIKKILRLWIKFGTDFPPIGWKLCHSLLACIFVQHIVIIHTQCHHIWCAHEIILWWKCDTYFILFIPVTFLTSSLLLHYICYQCSSHNGTCYLLTYCLTNSKVYISLVSNVNIYWSKNTHTPIMSFQLWTCFCGVKDFFSFSFVKILKIKK